MMISFSYSRAATVGLVLEGGVCGVGGAGGGRLLGAMIPLCGEV
jgi:hypothetical protein